MSMDKLGSKAIEHKGWWVANRWLTLRRLSQVSILLLFLLGPWAGVWIIKGNLSSSLLLDTVPLTDPHLLGDPGPAFAEQPIPLLKAQPGVDGLEKVVSAHLVLI